jgi:homoserine kinase
VSFVVKAPATSANLGPGFDCAGAALELWNELHVLPAEEGEPLVELEGVGADELPRDETHLALRAFAKLAPLAGRRFRFVNRIPLESGLGSSAACVAAGLVAGQVAGGLGGDLLETGLEFEGHADNLAPALLGGVCLIWREGKRFEARQIATELPLDPVVVVPAARVSTRASRARLPESLPHEDAADAAARAALLGAAIASGDPELLAAAFHDRLHEPFRHEDAPLLLELRHDLPTGAAGVTLSGSGPSVVVWAEKGRAEEVAAALRNLDALVLPLAIASGGTHAKNEHLLAAH